MVACANDGMCFNSCRMRPTLVLSNGGSSPALMADLWSAWVWHRPQFQEIVHMMKDLRRNLGQIVVQLLPMTLTLQELHSTGRVIGTKSLLTTFCLGQAAVP